MSKKTVKSKYQEYIDELILIPNDRERKKASHIGKIKKFLSTPLDEKVDFDILLRNIESFTDKTLYPEMLMEIIDKQNIEEKKKDEYTKLLLKSAFYLNLESRMILIDYLKKITSSFKNIAMKNPNPIMELLLFDCLMNKPSNESLDLIENFLQNNIALPKMFMDFIIEIVIQFAIVIRGKLASNLKTIFFIFEYYITKAKGTIQFLKKLIIAIICLEYSLEPKKDDYHFSWVLIKNFVSHNQFDALYSLLNINKSYFNDGNQLKSLFDFEQFRNYIIIEDINEPKAKRDHKIEHYQKIYDEFQKKLFEKEIKKDFKKEIIKESLENIILNPEIKGKILEGTFLFFKKLYCRSTVNENGPSIDYTLTNLLDILKSVPDENIANKSILKIFFDLLMSITLQYKDNIINNLYDILYLLSLKFPKCESCNIFTTDEKLIELGIAFIDKIFSFVVRGIIPLGNFEIGDPNNKSKQLIERNHIIDRFIRTNPINSESSILLKCILLFENFEMNAEELFKEYILKLTFPNVNCYLIELLKYHSNHNRRLTGLIEKYVFKYQTDCANSFKLNLIIKNTFIDLLTDVMVNSKNLVSFTEAMNDLLIVNHPNELLWFQINTLLMLYNKLNINYEYSKLQICNKIAFKKEMFMINGTLLVVLPFIKQISVNKEYDVFFSFLNCPSTELSTPSQIRLDIFGKSPNQTKEQAETFVHYVLLNHTSIFDYLLDKVDQLDIIKDNHILEIVLEICFIFTKQIFPLKAVDLDRFITILVAKNYFINNNSNENIFSYVLSIVINLCYHLNSNLNHSQNLNNNTLLDITDIEHKTKIIGLLINTYCELIIGIKKELKLNQKNNNNSSLNNSYKAIESSINSGKNVSFNTKKTLSNTNSKSQINIHDNHINNFNLFGNIVIPNQYNRQNQNIQDEISTKEDIQVKIKQISKIMSALHFYLNSITDYDLKTNHLFILNSPTTNELSYLGSKLELLITNLLSIIIDTLWIFQIKVKYGISIVNLLLGIKDLLFKMGDKVILKVILIAMIIGWRTDYFPLHILEIKIDIRITKDILDYCYMNKEKRLEYVYLEDLADTLALFFIERYTNSSNLLEFINEMMNNVPDSFRKYLFFELCKWNLSSRSCRDNLKHCYRGCIANDTQVFLGKRNIIMLVPKSLVETEIIIRNIISNTNILISAAFEKEDCFDALKFLRQDKNFNISLHPKEINNGENYSNSDTLMGNANPNLMEVSSEKPESENMRKKSSVNSDESDKTKKGINNSMVIFQQIINLTSESLDDFQYCPSNKLKNNISLLDSESVYTVFHCGVIYAKSNCLNNEHDIFSYSGEVSREYIYFLNSLGYLYNIEENKHINVGNMDPKGSNGKYVICYQNSLFQLVFHICNLISSQDKTEESLYNTRKSIISKDFVNIIWMDNPHQTFNENLITSGNMKVYLILCPISSTYYLVKNKISINSDFKTNQVINKILLEDFIININAPSSIMYLIQCIIQINMMQEYFQKYIEIKQETEFDQTEVTEVFNTNYLRRNRIISTINNQQ